MQKCFSDVNGGKPENRTAYTCQSCNESAFICEKCAKNCHAGHRVVYVGDKKFVCGCYMGYCGKCKISKSAQNENTKKEENQSKTASNQINKTPVPKEEPKPSSSYSYVYSNKEKNESPNASHSNQSANNKATQNKSIKEKSPTNEKTFYKEECESLSSFLSRQAASKASSPKEEQKPNSSYNYSNSNKNDSEKKLPQTNNSNSGQSFQKPNFSGTEKKFDTAFNNFIRSQAMMNPLWLPSISNPYGIQMTANMMRMNPVYLIPTGLPQEDYAPFIEYFIKRMNQQIMQNQQQTYQANFNQNPTFKYTHPDYCSEQFSFTKQENQTETDSQTSDYDDDSYNIYIQQSKEKSPKKSSKEKQENKKPTNWQFSFKMHETHTRTVNHASDDDSDNFYIHPSKEKSPIKSNKEQLQENKKPTNWQFSFKTHESQAKTVNQASDGDDDSFECQSQDKSPKNSNKEKQVKQKSKNRQQSSNSKKSARKARPDPERYTPKCESPYCQNPPLDGYSFCQEHKCAVDGCDCERYSEDYYKILPICYHHKCVVQYCNNQKLDGYSYCQKCKCHANGCKSKSRAGYKYCDKHYCAVTYTKCQNERIDSKIKLCHDHKCAECKDQRLNDKRAKYCRRHTCKSCGCYEHAVTSMSYCYKHLQKH